MNEFTPYLNFPNNCRDVMNFYAKCFDAKVEFMTFADAKQADSKDTADLIMHSALSKNGKVVLMASDCPPGMPLTVGNNVSISVGCESSKEVDQLFAALGVNGTPAMPPAKVFWGDYFAMVIDSYGIQWLLSAGA